MDEIVVESGEPRLGLEETPTHKVTITRDSDRYVFWYLKADSEL